MARQRDSSVSDFPPEFFQIWELAKANSLELEFASKGKATNFKTRLYRFRKTLARENPQMAEPFMSVDIESIEKNGKGYIVPYVPEWRKQLQAQNLARPGLTLTSPKVTKPDVVLVDWTKTDEEIAVGIATPETKDTSPLAETLGNLGFGSQEDKE